MSVHVCSQFQLNCEIRLWFNHPSWLFFNSTGILFYHSWPMHDIYISLWKCFIVISQCVLSSNSKSLCWYTGCGYWHSQMIYEESLFCWFVYIIDCPISLFLAKCADFPVGTYWKDVVSAPIDTTSRTTVKLELNLTNCYSVHCGESWFCPEQVAASI